jgi:hypothetical protein
MVLNPLNNMLQGMSPLFESKHQPALYRLVYPIRTKSLRDLCALAVQFFYSGRAGLTTPFGRNHKKGKLGDGVD